MTVQYIALAIMLPAMAVFAWMAVTTLQRAREGAAWSLGVYFALVIPGIGGAALQIVADDPTTLALAKASMFICRAGIPVALIAFVFDIMGRPFSGRTVTAMSLVPLSTLMLAMTNSAHGLIWSPELVDASGELVINPGWGPWYTFVHAPYSYLLLGGMMVMFFLRLSAVSAPQRRSMVLFLIIGVGPLLTGLLHSFGLSFDRLWLPALSVALTSPLFLWILEDLRHKRFRPVSYRELIEQIDDPVIGLDLAGRVVSINQAASELFGRKTARLLGSPLPADAPITGELQAALDSGGPLIHEGRRYELRKSDVLASDGQPRGQTLICRDVTAEQQARDDLSTSEQLMRTMVEHSSHGIVRLHRQAGDSEPEFAGYRCVFANAAAAAWAGVDKSSLEGRDAEDLLKLLVASWPGDRSPLVRHVLGSVAAGQAVDHELGLSGSHEGKWLRLLAEPVDNDVVLTLTDISAHMRRQLAAEQRASYDHLTGILNRHGLAESAETAISNTEGGVLLFVDLDDFKRVNDELGHQTGDELLREAAARLTDSCRPQDLVGRYGGDEFVILAMGLTADAEKNLVDRVTRAMNHSYQLGNQAVSCTASIGPARFPDHGQSLEALLAHADSEMYRSKRASSGRVSVPSALRGQ
ncbi:MAG: diguanylate cyclase [Xanthomonadales bacterium]|nr:diguanylate cyclase [Xanthomonadales bacterium]